MRRATSIILSFGTIASLATGIACGPGNSTSSSGSSTGSGSGTSTGSGSGSTATGSGSGTAATGASGASTAPCGPGTSSTSVSFSNQLMPIFQNNCSVGTQGQCHSDPGDAMTGGGQFGGGARQYFGPSAPAMNSTATLLTIYNGMVNVTSFDDPNINIVTPSNPAKSFILYKLNGTQAALDSETPDQCGNGDLGTCGSQMPLPLTGAVTTPLSQTDIDLVCNWIEQGAKNN